MEFLGSIEGMKLSPINNYNNYLKSNLSFDVDQNADFDAILADKTNAIQESFALQGGVQLNKFDDVVAQSSVQGIEKTQGETGHFLTNFGNSINSGLSSVNEKMEAANKAQEAFAMGEDISVHDVMIASEKASLSLQMAMQLRNKLLSAYTEINNIRV